MRRVLAGVLLLSTSCEKSSSTQASAVPVGYGSASTPAEPLGIPDDEEVPSGTPPPAPELPPPPRYDEDEVPERYDDGAWSIRGLRAHVDERVREGEQDTSVELWGWVQEIYVAPPCPSGAKCPPPQLPHLWVTDTQRELGKKRALLVVGYEFAIPEFQAKLWKGVPGIVMEKDRRYRLRGRFKRFSDTGFAHDAGLFELVATQQLDDKGKPQWVYPRGAWWHPAVEGKLK